MPFGKSDPPSNTAADLLHLRTLQQIPDPGSRPVKAHEIFGSLRFRLSLWSTAVMLIMVVATLWAVREGLRLALEREIDQLLTDDASEAELTVEEFYPDFERIERELKRKAATHAHYGLFIRLLDAEGHLIWQSDSVPSQLAIAGRLLTGPAPRTIGDYRVRRRDTDLSSMPRYSICVGGSLVVVEEDVQAVTKILTAIGAVVMLIVPIGGFWLAGRATKPLAQIIDTTSRLHPTKLDERLPLRGTRDELDRLSITINGFLDRIAAYLAQNQQFTADAAHELRSPLAAMRAALDVALATPRTPEEYQDILADTLEECDALSKLVNQLLLLAENDAGCFETCHERVEFDRLVARACEMFAPVAETREIELSMRALEPAEVLGDAARLRQVINNLLDNALKFTPAGGRVTVEVITDPNAREAILRVVDTGAGIPASDVKHIFERFYRADKSRQRVSRTGGTGLGLSICDSIVTAHGGCISAASQLGQGTTITVRLPLMPVDEPRPKSRPPASAADNVAMNAAQSDKNEPQMNADKRG
jgi:heavy metal sensor kinase